MVGHYVGEALVGAHEMECEQLWFGGALTSEAVGALPKNVREHLLDGGRCGDWPLALYDVPLKGNKRMRTLAVDWTTGIHGPAAVQTIPLDSPPDLRQKVINTETFHRDICRRCPSFSGR